MKIFHFADTHLGFSEYSRIDPQTGVNQREKDFYDSWNRIISDILDIKPDVVVHAGDLFHTSRPSNRAIRTALEGIQKVSESGIPMVLISGNHSTPRIKSTGSIFESIALFKNVYAAYQSEYRRFRIGSTDFHCIPHCSLTEDLERAFQAVEFDNADYNVLVTHGAWSGKQSFTMGEFNEQRISDPAEGYGLKFNYIALGHYHRHLDVAANAAYPGSTGRTSFNETGYSSGYLLIDLEKNIREYRQIPSRPMLRIGPLDCEGFSLNRVYEELAGASKTVPEGALVSLGLTNLSSSVFLKLEMRELDALFPQVFYLEKQVYRRGDQMLSAQQTQIGSLEVEFEKYIEKIQDPHFDKKQLVRLGMKYLSEK